MREERMSKTKSEDFGMTSHYWDGDVDKLVGRYWSRKINGFSAIWDGGVTRGRPASDCPWYTKGGDKEIPLSTGLWSLGRNGVVKVLHAPPAWLDRLPIGIPVHGELWYQDNTEYLKKHVKKKSPNFMYWNPIQFIIFSVKPYCTFPSIGLVDPDISESRFFHQRGQGKLLDWARELVTVNRTVSFIEMNMINSKVQGLEVLENFGRKSNWEGLMFLDPELRYEGKRSRGVLKYKPTFEDEAIVTGYEEGTTGARIGRVGTILAKYVITEKCSSLCGYKPDMLNRLVEIRISGLTSVEQEWDIVKEMYPTGSEIRFGYKLFSEHGQPQSCNIYRGL